MKNLAEKRALEPAETTGRVAPFLDRRAAKPDAAAVTVDVIGKALQNLIGDVPADLSIVPKPSRDNTAVAVRERTAEVIARMTGTPPEGNVEALVHSALHETMAATGVPVRREALGAVETATPGLSSEIAALREEFGALRSVFSATGLAATLDNLKAGHDAIVARLDDLAAAREAAPTAVEALARDVAALREHDQAEIAALGQRVDALSRKVDDLLARPADDERISRLEQQLATLTAQVAASRPAPQPPPSAAAGAREAPRTERPVDVPRRIADLPSLSGRKADFIAAARRAAQPPAERSRTAPSLTAFTARTDEEHGTRLGRARAAASRNRWPILLAAAAVAVALGAVVYIQLGGPEDTGLPPAAWSQDAVPTTPFLEGGAPILG